MLRLIEESVKGNVVRQHASVLIINGVPVEYGYNMIKNCRSEHAECNVINKFLTRRGLIGWVKEQRILSNYGIQWGKRSPEEYHPPIKKCRVNSYTTTEWNT